MTKPLSELIAEERKKNLEAFRNSSDKDVNHYHTAKQKRIEQGIEEVVIFNEDEDED